MLAQRFRPWCGTSPALRTATRRGGRVEPPMHSRREEDAKTHRRDAQDRTWTCTSCKGRLSCILVAVEDEDHSKKPGPMKCYCARSEVKSLPLADTQDDISCSGASRIRSRRRCEGGDRGYGEGHYHHANSGCGALGGRAAVG